MQILTLLALLACDQNAASLEVSASSDVQLSGVGTSLTVIAKDETGDIKRDFCGTVALTGVRVLGSNDEVDLGRVGGFAEGSLVLSSVELVDDVVARSGDAVGTLTKPRTIPGWLSVLPPLIAIILAVGLRQAMLALFAGIWVGATSLAHYNPLTGFLRVIDTYFVRAVADTGHASILLFTLALGGMVGLLAKSGGTHALVNKLSVHATSRRKGMVATWLTGLVLFFDDYANCLLVGNTLRPLTDKLKVSREKLAYLVDSTAAPITTVALISTWVGYQLGLIEDLAQSSDTSPYELFLEMLPYSFYSIFTIVFVFLIAASGRDFGPMRRAEIRAQGGALLRQGAQPLMDRELTDLKPADEDAGHWFLAVGPISAVLIIVGLGLYLSGRGNLPPGTDLSLRNVIAAADSYAVLLWAGFGGSLVAAVLSLATRSMRLPDVMDSWLAGVKAMMVACLILILAWTLGDLCKDHLMTGQWVLSMFRPGAAWIPGLTFVVSAVIALATGSSFSTMAIVIPITGAMAWGLTGEGANLSEATVWSIRYASLASVLGGAVFGDHCSPISDTTIMSSMSSASDHIDHVRTQAPYAISCAVCAVVFGYIPAGFGVSPWISMSVGLVAIAAIVYGIGRPLQQSDQRPSVEK